MARTVPVYTYQAADGRSLRFAADSDFWITEMSGDDGLQTFEDFLDCLQKLLLLGVALCKALIYALQVSILNCHKTTLLYIISNTAFMLPP